MPQVAWLFSLARCGSSITAYAGASPWGAPVADEIFGPWDRTGAPYNYPPEQRRLVERFQEGREHLTPEVVDLARALIDRIAASADRVIVKIPHLMIRPDEFAQAFPDHPAVHLLRNPLWRLNSLYARGWLDSIEPGYDLERFAVAAERWRSAPNRLTYEELAADPRAFFSRLWTMWGWTHSHADLDRAVEYQRSYHHADSASHVAPPARSPVSAECWCVPESASRAYLADARVRGYLADTGAPVRRAEYVRATERGARRGPEARTARARLSRARQAVRADAVRAVWLGHGRADRPVLLDLAAENGRQMLLCHRAIGSRSAVGIEIDAEKTPAPHELPIGCAVVQGDIQSPPASVAPESFDVVTALAALDGLERPRDAVVAAADRLRPGGLLVITSPSPVWRRLLSPGSGRSAVTRRALRAWLADAGLELVEERPFLDARVVLGALVGWTDDPERAVRQDRAARSPGWFRLNRLFVARKPALAGDADSRV